MSPQRNSIFVSLGNMFDSLLAKEALSYFFASACVILLPLYIWYIPPFMILWVVCRIIEIRRNKSIEFDLLSYPTLLFFLFVSFFAWQIVGLAYSENFKAGLDIAFSRLSLILFPTALILSGEMIHRNIRILLKLFTLSTALFILFCFINALYISTSFQNGELLFNPHPPVDSWRNYFFGTFFAINQHPSYLSMYVVFSAIFSFESGFDEGKKIVTKYLWFILGIYLLISVYFLSSRSGMISCVILIPLYFLYKFRKKLVVIFLILILLFFVLIPVLSTNERIEILKEEILRGAFKEKVKNDGRLVVWKSAIQIIKRNTVFGVGIGDVRDELKKQYLLIKNKDLIDNNYNVHNQYLETFVEGGIVGVFLFIMILILMLVISYRERNMLLALFVFLVMIFFMFETVLYRLAGVTFFSLLPFLLIQYQKKR
jgi:O-antigen ligase